MLLLAFLHKHFKALNSFVNNAIVNKFVYAQKVDSVASAYLQENIEKASGYYAKYTIIWVLIKIK